MPRIVSYSRRPKADRSPPNSTGHIMCQRQQPAHCLEPIPNEVDKTKQRNSDQDARHEEGPIVFW